MGEPRLRATSGRLPHVTPSLGLAPSPTSAPVPRGTSVILDEQVQLLERAYAAGGSPWRLVKLTSEGRDLLEAWRRGGEVGPGQERFARTLINQGLVHPRYAPHPDLTDVDVVVPVLDDTAGLVRLLNSLKGLPVTVVDDGSRNATSVADVCTHFGARLVRLDVNHGPAGARNAGLAATTRRFVCFIDSDVQMDNAINVLASLRGVCEDPLVGAVAPRVRGARGHGLRAHFEHSSGALDLGALRGLAVPGGHVPYVPSACLMVRRDAMGDGFDETLRCGEDVDLVWRLSDAGWLVRYEPAIEVAHPARSNWLKWLRQRVSYGESAGALATRHGARLAPLRTDRTTAAAWILTWLGQPALAARLLAGAHKRIAAQLPEADQPRLLATRLVVRGPLRAGGYLARAVVRTYGATLLVAALHPKLRKRALTLYALGTAWRWRGVRPSPGDVVLGAADDLAYGAGVVKGAVRNRTWAPLRPVITGAPKGND